MNHLLHIVAIAHTAQKLRRTLEVFWGHAADKKTRWPLMMRHLIFWATLCAVLNDQHFERISLCLHETFTASAGWMQKYFSAEQPKFDNIKSEI